MLHLKPAEIPTYLTDMWGSHESMTCGSDGIYLTFGSFNGTNLIFPTLLSCVCNFKFPIKQIVVIVKFQILCQKFNYLNLTVHLFSAKYKNI